MIQLEEQGKKWSSGEKISIPYTKINGNAGTCRPDFLVDNNVLVECKPKRLWNALSCQLKFNAFRSYCIENSLCFEVIDPPIITQKITDVYMNGLLVFEERYEKKFLEWIAK